MAPVVLIAPDTSRLNVERAVRRVSAERRALVERLLRVQDRQAALAAWLLLERALEWRYGIAEMGPWAREPGGWLQVESAPYGGATWLGGRTRRTARF